MKTQQIVLFVALALILGLSITSCVMVVAINEEVSYLATQDEKIMQEIQNKDLLKQPKQPPKITDSLAYYKSKRSSIEGDYGRTRVTVHRFFFKRAEFTDSLYNGFSITVAEIGNSGIITMNQNNVSVAKAKLGKEVKGWRKKVNYLTANNEPYFSLSDQALKVRSLLRTSKF